MDQSSIDKLPKGWKSIPNDLGSDQTAFKGVQWGKAMMWIFLLSDTFIFSCFLISYMKGRASTVVEALPFMYEIKKQLKTNVSLNRKIHIMAFPQCTPLNIVWSEPVSLAIPLKPGLNS